MIRINLLPAKKRPAKGAPQAKTQTTGQFWVLGWVLGWGLLAAAGWYLLSMHEERTKAVTAEAVKASKEADDISKEIDEAGLEESKRQLEEQKAAIEELRKKKRTPIYVLYELATMLTDPAASPADPPQMDIDDAKQKKIIKEDPRGGINMRWDPTGLWLTSLVEQNGVLKMEGRARDASDLTEFLRRLRVGGRFGAVKSPNYTRSTRRGDDEGPRPVEWTGLEVVVRRWD